MAVDGVEISTQKAVDLGLVSPTGKKPKGWGIARHEVPLGYNIFTDSGRQVLAYALAFRKPISNFVCTQFGVGVGTSPPKVTDTALEDPLTFYDSNSDTIADSQLKPLTQAAFPYPFIIDFEMSLSATEANTYLLTEFGLFSGSGVLIARKVVLGFNKSASMSPSFVWRCRT